MIAGRGHLKETRLFECYLAERAGEELSLRVAAHLAACAECADRYQTLAQVLDGERLDAECAADALFSPERLQSQRQHILARLEHAGHAARVLSFPARAVRRVTRPASHALPRWAAAAAAGIFLGMGLHIAYQGSQGEPYTEAQTAVQVTPPQPPALEPPSASMMDPDAFFSTLDAALGGPRDPELMPLDALTPLAREVSMQVR